MGQRSRKRRQVDGAAPAPAPRAERRERPAAYARSEAKNEAIRQGLEPLEPGERPGAVTAAAVVAVLFAIANVVASLTGNTIGSESSANSFTLISTALLLIAAAGMWFARAWAVLGFQVILGLQIVFMALALPRVEKLWVALLIAALVCALGFLFWKLVRALSRLQMPAR